MANMSSVFTCMLTQNDISVVSENAFVAFSNLPYPLKKNCFCAVIPIWHFIVLSTDVNEKTTYSFNSQKKINKRNSCLLSCL